MLGNFQLLSYIIIQWIEIYPVDGVTHPLNNWDEMIKYKSVNQPPASPTDRLLLVVMTDDVSSFSNKSGTSSVEPPIPKS